MKKTKIILPVDTAFLTLIYDVNLNFQMKSCVTTEPMEIAYIENMTTKLKARLFGNHIGITQVNDEMFFQGLYSPSNDDNERVIYVPVMISNDNEVILYTGEQWKRELEK